MFREKIISYILLAGIFACVNGFKEKGTILPPSVSTPFIAKLKSILNACSEKGIQFNAEEANSKIESCIQRFNELGELEHELPDRKGRLNWEDEAEVKADKERWALDYAVRVNSTCSQVTSTLGCFDPLKSIVDQCQSSEGITLFSLAAELCKNDGQLVVDYREAIEACEISTKFKNAINSCGSDSRTREKYFGHRGEPASNIFEFCNFGSFAFHCIKEGVAADPITCVQTSDLLQAFTQRVKNQASNAEAVTQCLFTSV